MPEQIYAVYANHEDRRLFLGLAVGNVQDIQAFYDERKAYGLDLERANIQYIPQGFASRKAALMGKKRELQQQLIELEAELKKFGG